MFVVAACHFFALWFALQALGTLTPVRLTSTSLRGVASVMLFLLLMRLYDELKDAKTDIALGRAGDPLYRDRVLVTGAVRIEDVKWLRWLVTAALVAMNLQPRLGWATIGVLGDVCRDVVLVQVVLLADGLGAPAAGLRDTQSDLAAARRLHRRRCSPTRSVPSATVGQFALL